VIKQTSYYALSYVWGDPGRTLDILINGISRPVTKNLESGLRHMRSESQNINLWVDAVCIDNSNIQERNEQVSNMDEIFASAARVIIGLGMNVRGVYGNFFNDLKMLATWSDNSNR
jgi:hypothetical protein